MNLAILPPKFVTHVLYVYWSHVIQHPCSCIVCLLVTCDTASVFMYCMSIGSHVIQPPCSCIVCLLVTCDTASVFMYCMSIGSRVIQPPCSCIVCLLVTCDTASCSCIVWLLGHM